MEINFDFVKNSSFADLYPAANKIYKLYTIEDYRDVISNSRLLLEAITKKIFLLENLDPYYPISAGEYRNLRNNTHYLRSHINYPLSIMDLFDEVRRMGNAAIHDAQIEPDKKQAWRCICDLHDILVFLINSYDNKNLYYIRPDISMETQTDEQHYYNRQKTQSHIKLHDHVTSKKKTTNIKTKHKKTKYFSSNQVNEDTTGKEAKEETIEHTSLWDKITQFWQKKKQG